MRPAVGACARSTIKHDLRYFVVRKVAASHLAVYPEPPLYEIFSISENPMRVVIRSFAAVALVFGLIVTAGCGSPAAAPGAADSGTEAENAGLAPEAGPGEAPTEDASGDKAGGSTGEEAKAPEEGAPAEEPKE